MVFGTTLISKSMFSASLTEYGCTQMDTQRWTDLVKTAMSITPIDVVAIKFAVDDFAITALFDSSSRTAASANSMEPRLHDLTVG